MFGCFLYDRNKVSSKLLRIYWECERRRDIACSVRLTTLLDGTPVGAPRGLHNHGSAQERTENLHIRNRLRQEVM